jgi:hypothetical protein
LLLANISRALKFIEKIPFFANTLDALIITRGEDRYKAHGQVIIKTEISALIALSLSTLAQKK